MSRSFLFTLVIALLFSFSAQRSSAQITSLTLEPLYDAIMPSQCVTPVEDSVLLYGYYTGTPAPADSIRVNVNFDDGFDTTVSAFYSGGEYWAAVVHHIHLPGTYSSLVTVTATGGATTSGASTPYILSDSCSTLTGTMYMDLNGNCVQDTLEPGMSYMPIYLLNVATGDTTLATWTDHNGHYAINLFPGNYVIITNRESMGGNVTPACPSSGAYTLTTTGGSYSENFAYQCATPTSLDMSAQLYYGPMDAGYNQLMVITAGDWFWFTHFTCTSLSATVTLTLDPRVTYISSIPGPGHPAPTVSGSTLTWNISTAADYFGLWDDIYVHVSDSLTLSDTLCNTLYVTPTSLTDPDLTNNTVAACTPVGASYDPNGKAVSPLGLGPQGYIANSTPLSYFIHFQNTGTAPATAVTVVDTLDANLDLQTLHVLNTSAQANIYMAGNVVTFRFDNIDLPDSATSPTASIGAIEYGVMPKSGLAPGTQIHNRAGIYFDYNPVVMTNTTLNTIAPVTTPSGTQQLSPGTTDVAIYPNPADDELTVRIDHTAYSALTITNTLGQQLMAQPITTTQTKVNVQSLPPGMYFLTLKGTSGVTVQKLEKL